MPTNESPTKIEKTPKQTRTPKQYDAIEKGALSLKMEQRIKLRKVLESADKTELEFLQASAISEQERFEKAKALLNGDKE